MNAHEELFSISRRLAEKADASEVQNVRAPIDRLKVAADEVGRSFSGSWLGYHSRVYYNGLTKPPPGANFSQEWGLKELLTDIGTIGDWDEFDSDVVRTHIFNVAGNPDLAAARKAAMEASAAFESAKSDALSVIGNALEEGKDAFLEKLNSEIDDLEILSRGQVLELWRPKGQFMTRDTLAAGQGMLVPPHMGVLADVASINYTFDACRKMSGLCSKAASHFERRTRSKKKDERVGTNVFIGHGRSLCWRELKDFVQDRLALPWDEFNRVPVAGVTNIARLSEMLDAAAIAFLVMTAEDEMVDGEAQARMNVVHEAGLFQGRLGFSRAIVLLEEGCAEFSNIQGLGQIRFPKGMISSAFEEIRRVLEREKIIDEK